MVAPFGNPGVPGNEFDPWTDTPCAVTRDLAAEVRTVAPTRATVLLTGETGVGKGVIARTIHRLSPRRERPFVAVHCGALPDTLLESELFGHEKGAFTDAHRRRPGKFELADGGTLFLDEIGTASLATQIKLLDVLQERRYSRVGGEEQVRVDVRIVAATNGDLRRMIEAGTFREDLFHRLNVFAIDVAPLRERKGDLPRMVTRLIAEFNAVYGRRLTGLAPDVEAAFSGYDWPGNVRELENVVERAAIMETGAKISSRSIPRFILEAAHHAATGAEPSATGGWPTLAQTRDRAIATAERQYLVALLARHEGRMEEAASVAGMTSRQLRKLVARHAIRREDFSGARLRTR